MMGAHQGRTPLFATQYSEDLAQRMVGVLWEAELHTWRRKLEHDLDEPEVDDEGHQVKLSADEVAEPTRPGEIVGPPVAAAMTPEQIAQAFAEGEDPWACLDLARDPRGEIPLQPTALLAALLFSATIESEEALATLFRQGGICHFACRSDRLREALGQVVLAFIAHLRAEEPKFAGASVSTITLDKGGSASDERYALERYKKEIDSGLRKGRAVVAIGAEPRQLSAVQASLIRLDLRLPQISADVILAMLRLTHSSTGQLAEAEILRRLPGPEALGRLEPMQIEAAFAESSTLRVADRLAEIARAGTGAARVTLDDIEGLQGALAPARRMLNDLQAWREGRAAWSEVTRSALFYGPPGTGKTTIARGIAGSAGVPLIATSYSDCQRHGHQGDMLAALSRAFAEAAQAAPAVIFVDELDSFSKRSAGSSRDDYLRGVVNGLLEQINKAIEVEGLLLVGATNHLRDIDPAIVRAGRFDLKLQVPLPDRDGIEAILARKLGSRATSAVSLREISGRLLGTPGATAEALVRDALGRARAERGALRQEHLEAAADALSPPVEPALFHRMALHEAGHVLAAFLLRLPTPKRVWVSPRGGNVDPGDLTVLTPKLAHAQLQMMLAGRAAEVLVLGQPSNGAGEGVGSDLAQATRLATAIELQFGFGDTGLTWQDASSVQLQTLSPKVQHRIRQHLAEADNAVRQKLGANIDLLNRFTTELIARRELSAADLEAFSRAFEKCEIKANADPRVPITCAS